MAKRVHCDSCGDEIVATTRLLTVKRYSVTDPDKLGPSVDFDICPRCFEEIIVGKFPYRYRST